MIKKISFYFFAFLAIIVAFYPLTYFVIDRNFGLLQSKDTTLLNNTIWNIGFYTHILGGGLALLIGWSQFSDHFRAKYLNAHRLVGKLYMVFVLLSGLAGLGIAFRATGGPIAALGFMSLALIWLYTTIRAFIFIKNKDVKRHKIMMVYSYASCFAAVTLRIYLPLLIIIFGDFIPAYQMVAWLCWVPNIFVAYFINQKTNPNNIL